MSEISYLISAYNSDDYIDRHCWDLTQQSLEDFEAIMVVCSHKDEMDHDIAKKWSRKDKRFRYIPVDHREPYGISWFRAWQAATSPIVSNSNTDDFHFSEFGMIVTDAFKDLSQDVGFIYTGLQITDEDGVIVGETIKPPFDKWQFSRECLAGPQVSWRRNIIDKCDLQLIAEMAALYKSGFDYALWMYFMKLGVSGFSIPRVLSVYTQRPDSIENSNKWANNWDTFHAMARFFPENTDIIPPEFLDDSCPPRDAWAKSMKETGQWKK